ncbi:hypothetical protein Hanom_Chr03g00258171 [Helianthus anomalus]
MFTSNCRRCPFGQKFTGGVLNLLKSCTFCPLGQTWLEISVKNYHVQGKMVIYLSTFQYAFSCFPKRPKQPTKPDHQIGILSFITILPSLEDDPIIMFWSSSSSHSSVIILSINRLTDCSINQEQTVNKP